MIFHAWGTKLRGVHACHTLSTHQLDVSVANNGAELTQVSHHPIENLSDAFPLVAAHFLDTGQLHLQSHEVRLRAQSIREEKGGEEKRWKREKIQADGMHQGGSNEGPKCIAESTERQSHLTCETLTQPHSQPRNPSGKI